MLSTVITGTILATGKTFAHGLGTTPDIVIPVSETSALGSAQELFVSTFDQTNVVIGGPIDDAEVRIFVQKIHSIIA